MSLAKYTLCSEINILTHYKPITTHFNFKTCSFSYEHKMFLLMRVPKQYRIRHLTSHPQTNQSSGLLLSVGLCHCFTICLCFCTFVCLLLLCFNMLSTCQGLQIETHDNNNIMIILIYLIFVTAHVSEGFRRQLWTCHAQLQTSQFRVKKWLFVNGLFSLPNKYMVTESSLTTDVTQNFR